MAKRMATPLKHTRNSPSACLVRVFELSHSGFSFWRFFGRRQALKFVLFIVAKMKEG